MKAAYHFLADVEGEKYDYYFYKMVFPILLNLNLRYFSSKILVGDLLIHEFSKGDTDNVLTKLLQLNNKIWRRVNFENVSSLIKENVFVICFETIENSTAEKLHKALSNVDKYLGAFEIDDEEELHWWLYGKCIVPKFRIMNRDLNILELHKELEDYEYLEEQKAFFKKLLFENVKVEYTDMRYSLMDDNQNYEKAKRLAQWKKSTESLFSTVIDEILGKLYDTAPDLGDKLWAITKTFDNAETDEEYAQAMSSCRRVFEYVTDCIFPATNEIVNGHSLKKDKYKNRLFEFANQEIKSKTNIDLIVANTNFLFEEWTKLYDLANKGVHSETFRQECRRCIIRTILLLDDIVSLRTEPFIFNTRTDKFIDGFRRYNK